jgi:hypothetical protein
MHKQVAFWEFRQMQMIAMQPLLHVLTFGADADALLPKLLSEIPE